MASETLPTPTHKATLQITHLFPIFIKRPAISNNFTPSHPIYTQSFQFLYTPFPFPSCLSKSSPICKDWAQKQSQVEMIARLRTLWGAIICKINFPYSTSTVSWPSSCILSRSLTFKCLPLLLCPALWVPYRLLIHILSFFWSILPRPCTK